MYRILICLISVAVVATACGDDGEISAAEWCERAQEVEDISNTLDTPDDFRAFRDAIRDVRDSVPSEIRDDVRITANFLDTMADALDDNDDNIILAFDQVEQNEDLGDYQAAGEAISNYNATECGIGEVGDDDEPSVDDDEADFSEGVIAGLADQLGIPEDDARCLVEKLDLSDGETPDVASMFDVLEECDIDPLSLATG